MFINKIRVADYSKFQADTCRNGGNYGFSTYFHRVGADSWEVEYTSTADFDMCPFCGNFVNDNNCPCGRTEPEVVTSDEVRKAIEENLESGDRYGGDSFFIQSWSTDEEYGSEVDKRIGLLLKYAY